jgi:hypothetical protein
MTQLETNEVLRSILEMLKQQAIHLNRHYGWLVAVADTLQKDPKLAEHLKQHPFYDQGPAPTLQRNDDAIQNIDALIRQLKG